MRFALSSSEPCHHSANNSTSKDDALLGLYLAQGRGFLSDTCAGSPVRLAGRAGPEDRAYDLHHIGSPDGHPTVSWLKVLF